MNQISKIELLESKAHGLTMKDLRLFVHNNPKISNDTKVLCERIEDKYFDGVDISGMSSSSGILPEGSKSEGWKVLLIPGYEYMSAFKHNNNMLEEIERRKKGEEPQYPKIENPEECMYELTDDLKVQFFQSWCISTDENFIYIQNHY